MRTAPTRALEVLVNLPFLHLYIENEALKTVYRLSCLGYLGIETDGYSGVWERAMERCPSLPMRTDYMTPLLKPDLSLKIFLPNREDWDGEHNLPKNGSWWYTDGSRQYERAGAGVFGRSTGVREYYPIGKCATIFTAEIYAILQCAHLCVVTSRLMSECNDILNGMTRNGCTVRLVWVPGHSGIRGNEEVDHMAKLRSAIEPHRP